MAIVQEAEVSSIFNHMFARFAEPGEQRLENLQEDIGGLSTQLELNDDMHATLTHVALAAGSNNPEYGAVSRAFTEMAELVIANAAQSSGPYRQVLQHDACVLLVYAETAAPRGRDGRIQDVYADPIIDTALRLLDTQPDPQVEELVNQSTALLQARLNMPEGRRRPLVKGAPHLDALARVAQRTLQRHMH